MYQKLIKIISSIPVILVFLYFFPIAGICLLLLRFFLNNKQKRTSLYLIGFGIILLVPFIINEVFSIFKLDIVKIHLDVFIDSNIYNTKIISYSKLLITVGFTFLVIAFIFELLIVKLKNSLARYLINIEAKNYEISQKNDLIMKEKQEKAKNTQVIYCPYCGADNILSTKIGKCKYCRRTIKSRI